MPNSGPLITNVRFGSSAAPQNCTTPMAAIERKADVPADSSCKSLVLGVTVG